MSQIILIPSDPVDVVVPPTGKAALFSDSTDGNAPAFKTDDNVTHSLRGAQGAAGSDGTNGTNGSDGTNGTNGAQGAAGTNGTNGSDGAQGDIGPQGAQGDIGSTGAQGNNGSNGNAGAQGSAGAAGAAGAQGANGSNGAQGAVGATGAQGLAGSNGAQGATGSQGAAGTNGTNGTNGSTGAQGAVGATGAQGASGGGGSGGGLVLLEIHSGSNVASLDFTTRNATGQSGASFQSDYNKYVLELVSLVALTNAVQVNLLVSTDGGSTWKTANYATGLAATRLGSIASVPIAATNAVMLNNSFGTGVTRAVQSGRIEIKNPLDSTLNKIFNVAMVGPSSDGTWYSFNGGAIYDSATAVNAVQIKMSSGNENCVGAYLYGVVNS